MPLTSVIPIIPALGVGMFYNHHRDWIHLGSVVATVQPIRCYVALLDNGHCKAVTIENQFVCHLSLSVVADLYEPIALNAEGSSVPFRNAVLQP